MTDAPDATFEAVVAADRLRAVVAAADAVVDECVVALDPEGLRVSAVDPASVALVELSLSADAFESYRADGGRIGVDLDRLDEVLGMADGEAVVLALNPETRKLEIEIGDLDYTLALIDPGAVRSPPDRAELDIEYDGEAVLDAAAVDRALRAAGMVADHVRFRMGESGTIHVEAEGDTDDVSLTVEAESLHAVDPGEAESLFSLDYLDAINRAIRADDVAVSLGTEHPIELGYEFAEGAGEVEYVVSPRRAVR